MNLLVAYCLGLKLKSCSWSWSLESWLSESWLHHWTKHTHLSVVCHWLKSNLVLFIHFVYMYTQLLCIHC